MWFYAYSCDFESVDILPMFLYQLDTYKLNSWRLTKNLVTFLRFQNNCHILSEWDSFLKSGIFLDFPMAHYLEISIIFSPCFEDSLRLYVPVHWVLAVSIEWSSKLYVWLVSSYVILCTRRFAVMKDWFWELYLSVESFSTVQLNGLQ